MVINDNNAQNDVSVIDKGVLPSTNFVAKFDIAADGIINSKNTPN